MNAYEIGAVILMLISITLFVKSYRDIDASFNLLNMVAHQIIAPNWGDTSLSGQFMSINDLYKVGLSEMFIAFALYMCSFILLMMDRSV